MVQRRATKMIPSSYRIPISATTKSARINVKERKVRRVKKRKGVEAQRVKPPTPPWAIDALAGDEEQKGKQKRTKRKKQKGKTSEKSEEKERDRDRKGATPYPTAGN